MLSPGFQMHLIILPKCHILLLMKILKKKKKKLLDTDTNYIWCFVYVEENKRWTWSASPWALRIVFGGLFLNKNRICIIIINRCLWNIKNQI